ncbi:TRAP transporter substrate-binding protein DctP [Thermodesulfobacteriota bacterium]
MKNLKLLLVILIGLMLAVIPDMGICAEAKPITLTYASHYSPPHPGSLVDLQWIEKIEKETNGRIKIKPYWGATLITVRDSFKEVESGTCDIGYVVPAYVRAGFHIQKAASKFYYGVPSMEVSRRIYKEVYSKFPDIRAEYANVKVLAIYSPAMYALHTRKKPVRMWKDMKGMKLKSTTVLHAALKGLGAAPINMPMGESYMALEKGIINGLLSPYETLKTFKFAEVVKYSTALNYYSSPYPGRAMNLDSWKRLPRDIQKVFEDSIEFWGSEMIKKYLGADKAGMDLGKKMGVEFIKLPAEELNKFYDLLKVDALKVAKGLDSKGLPGTSIFNEVRGLIEKYSK